MLSEHGDVEGARAAYQQAIDSRHPEHAPAAAFRLGLLLGQHGDWAGAQAAYWYAANSGHPEHAPPAARNLGHLFKRQGRFRQAREAYELAIHSGHPDVAPWSMVYLGNLLVHYRNPEGARACYQAAAESGHPEAARQAAKRLDACRCEAPGPFGRIIPNEPGSSLPDRGEPVQAALRLGHDRLDQLLAAGQVVDQPGHLAG